MKSWNEIRKAATAFSNRWKTAFDEKSQARSFGRRVRGHRRKISRGERRERGGRDAATLYILDDPKLTPDFDRRNPDSADGKVNGICDLIDFTPIYMDVSCIRDLPKKLRDNLTFKLRHESEAVNVVWTDLVQMSVGTFQKDDVAVCGQDVCWASNRHRLFVDDPEREFEMKVVLSAFASAALSMTCFSKAVYNKEVWWARDNGAKFDVMLSVINDEGTPVANARCGGWMCMEHDSKHGRGYAVFTDTNGCVRVTGECSEWFSITIAQTELNKVLGDGIPATSFAAGANETGGVEGNYNYQNQTPNGWPLQRQKKRGEAMVDTWLHSDLKNVAFYYVYKLFEKIKKGE